MGNPLATALVVDPVTPEQIRRARRTVAHHARDTAEARTLLDMLGIPHTDEGET